MFKFLFKLVILVAIGYGAYLYFNDDAKPPKLPDNEISYEDIVNGLIPGGDDDEEDDESDEVPQTPEESEEDDAGTDAAGLPKQIKLAVPFTPQAPHANWSLPYQEACEEASLYMVHEYYAGTPSGLIDPNVADAKIKELVAFQEDYFGYYLDTTAAETARIADMFFGMGATVVENPTVAQMKAEIAAGRPVILPAAGRKLPNPNFSGEGPLYHMLVIKGYTEEGFITNDPGTRNGNDFFYTYSALMSAMGDWNGGDPVNGAKRVIFTSP